jgi:adenosylmethionine-8-amino-7-oxononanoate aminotransferase
MLTPRRGQPQATDAWEETMSATLSVPRPAIDARKQGGPIQNFFAPPGTPRLPQIDRGEGIYMWDTDGRRYIDVSSGPVANNLGHAHPRVLKAMMEQASRIAFAVPGHFESAAAVDLADLLAELAGPGFDRAFFVSGGSEAIESALKFARQHAVATGQESRWKIISRDPSYHGATLGALAVSGDKQAERVFGPMARLMPKVPTPFTYRVPENHTVESWGQAAAAALEQEILQQGPESVLAFILEPVGGLATGALVAPAEYYRRVRDICTRYGVLLLHDEVMSGAGRTGRFLSGEHWGVRPDIVVLAKGLAAGYTPFGAFLAPAGMVETVARAGGFMNGFTYFTNPLSCAVALAVTREVVEQGLIARAARLGALLRAQLDALAAESAIIGDVRGLGLLLAMEFVGDKATKQKLPIPLQAPMRFQRLAMRHGLAVYSRRTNGGAYGDWMMVSPPLTVTEEQIEEIIVGLRRALQEFELELRKSGDLA